MIGILRCLIMSNSVHISHLSKPEIKPENEAMEPGAAIDRPPGFRLKRRVSPNH